MQHIIDRFISYVTIDTESDANSPTTPSTKKQLVLANLLVKELKSIGLTDVTVNYDRPAVKGREGKIWGQLVHYGYKYQDFGTSKAAPWRAGANENTTITFSTDVKIEGKTSKKYSF